MKADFSFVLFLLSAVIVLLCTYYNTTYVKQSMKVVFLSFYLILSLPSVQVEMKSKLKEYS